MTDERVIAALYEEYGGWKGSADRGERRKEIHIWYAYGQKARPVLEAIRPFLIIKADRATWALKFLDGGDRAMIKARFDADVDPGRAYLLRNRA